MSQKQKWFRGAGRLLWFLVPPLMLLVAAVFTIQSKAASEAKVARTTKILAVQHVATVHPERGHAVTEFSLPGTTEAFMESPIFARSSGYLKTWTKDIGSRVHEGELLAVIDTPELDQQLTQSRALLAQSEANLKLAEISASRYRDLIGSHSVSQQEVDQNDQNAAMLAASSKSAAAEVQRLEQLQKFERVCAPFDGVITARNTDVGDLITSGGNGPGKELFRIAKIDVLRVFVNVPEDYSGGVRPGLSARVSIAGFAGKEFPAKVARYANTVDPSSRTMRTELDIPNGKGLLIPGVYASAIFNLYAPVVPLILPANTLIFQAAGTQVGVVDQNGWVRLRTVTIGRDLGASLEVTSGLHPTDAAITNPSDSLTEGTQVTVQNGIASRTGSE